MSSESSEQNIIDIEENNPETKRIFMAIKRDKITESIINYLGLIFILYTIVQLIIDGFRKRVIYIFLALCITSFLLCELKLIMLFKTGDMNPRFGKTITEVGFSVVSLCVIVLIMIFT